MGTAHIRECLHVIAISIVHHTNVVLALCEHQANTTSRPLNLESSSPTPRPTTVSKNASHTLSYNNKLLRLLSLHNAASYGNAIRRPHLQDLPLTNSSSPRRRRPQREARTWKFVVRTKRRSTSSARCTRKRRH